ncbi:MAG: PilZ domain-containing protein [Desulfobulbaceae bacterium]|nr:PilZ domain-containing protein [Desulfobulbaceae bacterium]
MTEANELRGAHRAPMGTKIKWSIAGSSQWYEDTSQNISSTGMLLRTQESIEPGSPLKLTFNLPNLKHLPPISVGAEVVREVRRNDRQIGLGLRFMTLKSTSYQVIEEFVYRILDLSLDETMAKLASQNSSGYSFQMESLIREAEAKKLEAMDRQIIKEQVENRRASFKLWVRRGILTALLLWSFFLLFKTVCVFLDFADCLNAGH